jgi:hypothetical protein
VRRDRAGHGEHDREDEQDPEREATTETATHSLSFAG